MGHGNSITSLDPGREPGLNFTAVLFMSLIFQLLSYIGLYMPDPSKYL